MHSPIDTTFDFRSDTRTGRDPDTYSETLRRYHQLLWSKPLPNGVVFELEHTRSSPPYYLGHRSEVGEFVLSSDAVVPSFTRDTNKDVAAVIRKMPKEELDAFNTLGYTMGGMMIWPANQVGRRMTINAQRGCHPRIKDRFDLTVECIRRYYNDPSKLFKEYNPLGKTLARYADFFALFGDFRGYVEFFLLQDLVSEDFSEVRFMMPFDGDEFVVGPMPKTVKAYRAYKKKASDFIRARNQRILESSRWERGIPD
jgi:hypothetical protein